MITIRSISTRIGMIEVGLQNSFDMTEQWQGIPHFPKDNKQAVYWHAKSTEQGNARTQLNLGRWCYAAF